MKMMWSRFFLIVVCLLVKTTAPAYSQMDSDTTAASPDPRDLSGSNLDENLHIGEIPEVFSGASFEERAIFSQAKSFFDQGNYEISRSSLEDFIAKHSDSSLLPDVLLLLGETYAAMGKESRATEYFENFIEWFPGEIRLKPAQHRLSGLYFKIGALDKVLALWDGIQDEDLSRQVVYDKLVTLYLSENAHLEALRVLMKKRNLSSDSVNRALAEQEIILFIREKLKEEPLKSVVAEFGMAFPSDEALIRLIQIYDGKGDYYHEEQEVIRFLSQFPNHAYAFQARQLLGQIKDKIKQSRYLIAAILPLSGQLAPFGTQALYGAELALQLFKEELPGAGHYSRWSQQRLPYFPVCPWANCFSKRGDQPLSMQCDCGVRRFRA